MRSPVITIVFPKDLIQKIDNAAIAKYISRSAFIREAVAEKIDRDFKVETDIEIDDAEEEFDWEKLLNDPA